MNIATKIADASPDGGGYPCGASPDAEQEQYNEDRDRSCQCRGANASEQGSVVLLPHVSNAYDYVTN